jgi:hypothetical protein
MQLKLNLNLSKKAVVLTLLVIILVSAATALYLTKNNSNPIPTDIKNKADFKVIYPSKTSQIDKSSYQYQDEQNTLTFNVIKDGDKIIFSQQPAPDNLGSDSQPYYPALGIHPYAQFKTSLGQVALTKFWQSQTLKPAGQSAVLASGGTLLIANSQKNLSNAEWKNLFESLKIAK